VLLIVVLAEVILGTPGRVTGTTSDVPADAEPKPTAFFAMTEKL
jgi:hypothetical protein